MSRWRHEEILALKQHSGQQWYAPDVFKEKIVRDFALCQNNYLEQRFSNWEARTILRGGANINRKPSCWTILRGLPGGLLLGEARMLTTILKGGGETQSLKTTGLEHFAALFRPAEL